MGWLRRSPFSAAALLVYLFASVAGALHHHEDDNHPGSRNAAVASLHQNTGGQAADDDGHSCAICTALHQAKTSGTFTFVVASLTRVRNVVLFTTSWRPLAIPTFTQARAPPAN